MIGLIYKDCVVLWRSAKILLLTMLIVAAIPTDVTMGYVIAVPAVIPYALIQSDETSRWTRLSVMLPYSDAQLALSKYLMGWGLALAASAISIASQTIFGMNPAETAMRAMLLLSLSTLLSGMLNPIAFRFGTQRGRLLFSALFALPAAVTVIIGADWSAALTRTAALPCVAPLLAALVNALSVLLSQRWLRRGAQA